MSLPVTPTESMSRWTVIVRRDDGPTAEVDVDTSTTSTPLSSPLRRACAESLPDVALDQHHVIALPSPPAGASRRVVLTSNRDDLAMRSMLRCRTPRHADVAEGASLRLEMKEMKEMLEATIAEAKAAGDAREAISARVAVMESREAQRQSDMEAREAQRQSEMEAREAQRQSETEAREAQRQSEMEADREAMQAERRSFAADLESTRDRLSRVEADLRELFNDKWEVVSHAVFKYSALDRCPNLRQKKKRWNGPNPLKEGLQAFVASPSSPEYLKFCSYRPTAHRVLTPSFIQTYLDDHQPRERHRMSHPEMNVITLMRQTFEVVAERERRTGGESAAGRRMLDMLLCVLGPFSATDILGQITAVDEGFEDRFASLLAYAGPHFYA